MTHLESAHEPVEELENVEDDVSLTTAEIIRRGDPLETHGRLPVPASPGSLAGQFARMRHTRRLPVESTTHNTNPFDGNGINPYLGRGIMHPHSPRNDLGLHPVALDRPPQHLDGSPDYSSYPPGTVIVAVTTVLPVQPGANDPGRSASFRSTSTTTTVIPPMADGELGVRHVARSLLPDSHTGGDLTFNGQRTGNLGHGRRPAEQR